MDEYHLVALTVAVEAILGLLGTTEPDLDVVVPHQQSPAADQIPKSRKLHGREEHVLVLVRHPLFFGERFKTSQSHDSTRRLQVIENRVVPRKALHSHHLLRQQAILAPHLSVAFGGHFTETEIDRHRTAPYLETRSRRTA